MLANLNSRKGPYIEVLNYLSTSTHCIDPVRVGLTTAQFTERAQGSFVEERGASIVWRFWSGPTGDCPDRQ